MVTCHRMTCYRKILLFLFCHVSSSICHGAASYGNTNPIQSKHAYEHSSTTDGKSKLLDSASYSSYVPSNQLKLSFKRTNRLISKLNNIRADSVCLRPNCGSSLHIDSVSEGKSFMTGTIHESPVKTLLGCRGGSYQIPSDTDSIVYSMTYAHAMTVEECLKTICMSVADTNKDIRDDISVLDTGLSSFEVLTRRSTFGMDELQNPKRDTVFQQLLEQFDDRLVQVLLGVAILSAALASFEHSEEAIEFYINIFHYSYYIGFFLDQRASHQRDNRSRLSCSIHG